MLTYSKTLRVSEEIKQLLQEIKKLNLEESLAINRLDTPLLEGEQVRPGQLRDWLPHPSESEIKSDTSILSTPALQPTVKQCQKSRDK